MIRTLTNDNFFKEIDSEEKAYLLGFFVADGSICMNARCKNSYKFGITLSESDQYVVQWYHDFICPDRAITHYQSTNGAKNRKPVYAVSWTSNIMKEYMENKYKIVPNKTYDLDFVFPFEHIPEEFQWDYIRGFFDGDGQISYSEKTRQSTFALYSTSKPYMEQLGNMFEQKFGVEKRIEGTIKTKMELFCLRFSAHYKRKEFFLELYKTFYKNKKYFLVRKEEKFRKYLMFKYRVNQEDFERLLDNVERRE